MVVEHGVVEGGGIAGAEGGVGGGGEGGFAANLHVVRGRDLSSSWVPSKILRERRHDWCLVEYTMLDCCRRRFRDMNHTQLFERGRRWKILTKRSRLSNTTLYIPSKLCAISASAFGISYRPCACIGSADHIVFMERRRRHQ